MLLSSMLLAAMMLLTTTAVTIHGRHNGRSSLEINIHPSFVLFGSVLETQFLAYLLDSGFDFLDVVHGVVSLAHNPIYSDSNQPPGHQLPLLPPTPSNTAMENLHMQMRLSVLLCISNPLFQNLFCFFHKLTV